MNASWMRWHSWRKPAVSSWRQFNAVHKRMTTDEHYDERQDDLKKAAELIEKAFVTSFARVERVMKKMACNSAAYSAALNCGGRI